jgi:hypothetical protein
MMVHTMTADYPKLSMNLMLIIDEYAATVTMTADFMAETE